MTEILKEDNGKISTMRIMSMIAVLVAAFLLIWPQFESIEIRKQALEINKEYINWLLALAFGGKLLQKTQEKK